MPQGDISSEEGVGGRGAQFSTYQVHHRNIFKSIFTLGLFASFCLPVIDIRRLHFLSRDMHIKNEGPTFRFYKTRTVILFL